MSKVKQFPRSKAPLGSVIAIGNQKGGVGKSTNATHLAAALGEAGYRTLIIDLDPTAGSTKLLGVPTESFEGSLELLTGKETLSELTLSGKFSDEVGEGAPELPPGVDLIPARKQLSEIGERLLSNRFLDRTKILDQPLRDARKIYDFILLDTPPSPGDAATVAAYAAAEWFLLSVFPEPLAISGLTEAIGDITEVRKTRNKKLEVLGVVIGGVKRTSKYWQQIEELVSQLFPGRGFHTTISHSVELLKAGEEGVTLFQKKKTLNHKCAVEYRELANEIAQRVTNRDKFLSKAQEQYRKLANG